MIKIKFKNFIIKGIESSEMRKKDILDFLNVHNIVFECNKTEEWFKIKYLENLYGNSLILLCYDKEKCIGTQCFLKGEIKKQIVYQSADSAILEIYQGLGIFSKLIEIGQEILGKEQYIYGFPNNNSLKTFINHGWYINERKKYSFFKKEFLEIIPEIENQYLDMLLRFKLKDLFYIRKGKEFLLVKKRKYNIYLVLGKINKEKIKKIERVFFPLLICYTKLGTIGNGMILVENYHKKGLNPEIYMMDTLLDI